MEEDDYDTLDDIDSDKNIVRTKVRLLLISSFSRQAEMCRKGPSFTKWAWPVAAKTWPRSSQTP